MTTPRIPGWSLMRPLYRDEHPQLITIRRSPHNGGPVKFERTRVELRQRKARCKPHCIVVGNRVK